MSEEFSKLPTREDVWLEHVKQAEEFSGSALEYCQRNNLNPSTFGGWKRRFGFSKKSKLKDQKSESFKKVAVVKSKAETNKSSSPEWVARFLKEFLS